MTYRVIERYDSRMPSSPRNRARFVCIFGHDTEGGVGAAGAQGTINFLINTAGTRNASYSEMWAFEQGSGDFTVLRIVPPTRAAHSVSPHPPVYNPDAVARSVMGAGVNDPNQAGYAVSVAGKVADVDRWARDARFLAGARRRRSELNAELGVSRIVEHFRLQPSNRTDWGKTLTAQMGGVMPDTATEEDDVYEWIPHIVHEQARPGIVAQGAIAREAPRHDAPEVNIFPIGATPEIVRQRTVEVLGHVKDAPGYPPGLWWVIRRQRMSLVANSQMDDAGQPGTPAPANVADCSAAVAQAIEATNQEWREWLSSSPAAAA
ncbi:MAG: hypothetical protein LC798_11260 [Chloroflexi bacterium]|nr:hypothetical protein [Chloroflexota bacterium]